MTAGLLQFLEDWAAEVGKQFSEDNARKVGEFADCMVGHVRNRQREIEATATARCDAQRQEKMAWLSFIASPAVVGALVLH